MSLVVSSSLFCACRIFPSRSNILRVFLARSASFVFVGAYGDPALLSVQSAVTRVRSTGQPASVQMVLRTEGADPVSQG